MKTILRLFRQWQTARRIQRCSHDAYRTIEIYGETPWEYDVKPAVVESCGFTLAIIETARVAIRRDVSRKQKCSECGHVEIGQFREWQPLHFYV